ncbi:MAG: hypothetical protein CO108_08000 [Deltaproteobacteria bacterium CG_4_9_14_3_um_filter_63_12]|nr:MAG: hypothetical protein CO108_08000 [Deltaproteobacteria bacterium CG_4_9_14_3_um_filter_63_12]
MQDVRSPNELIATVGSNPLPIVVSALTRRAPRLHLVVTPEVEGLAERIWSLLETPTEGRAHVARGERLVLSANAAMDVPRLCSELGDSPIPWARADLDYTGGTKMMAAEVRAFWRSQNSTGATSYLSEKGRLIWGRPPGVVGAPWSPPEAKLTFNELASLHFERPLTPSDKHQSGTLGPAADRILSFLRDDGFPAWRDSLPPFRPMVIKNDGLTYTGASALSARNLGDDQPLMKFDVSKALNVAGLGRSIDDVAKAIGANGTIKEKRLKALGWLEGDWLEIAFARLLQQSRLFDEVHQDVHQSGTASGDEFQVDVVAVKGHRAYLFSCTTDHTPSLCKSKLFEAAHRAGRLGGEYARVALVSLMDKPHAVITNVREDGWHGYDQFRSFGLPHLKDEAGATSVDAGGQEGPSESLHEALKAWVDA